MLALNVTVLSTIAMFAVSSGALAQTQKERERERAERIHDTRRGTTPKKTTPSAYRDRSGDNTGGKWDGKVRLRKGIRTEPKTCRTNENLYDCKVRLGLIKPRPRRTNRRRVRSRANQRYDQQQRAHEQDQRFWRCKRSCGISAAELRRRMARLRVVPAPGKKCFLEGTERILSHQYVAGGSYRPKLWPCDKAKSLARVTRLDILAKASPAVRKQLEAKSKPAWARDPVSPGSTGPVYRRSSKPLPCHAGRKPPTCLPHYRFGEGGFWKTRPKTPKDVVVAGKKQVFWDYEGRLFIPPDQKLRVEHVETKRYQRSKEHRARCYVYARATIVPHQRYEVVKLYRKCGREVLEPGFKSDTARPLPSFELGDYCKDLADCSFNASHNRHISGYKRPIPRPRHFWKKLSRSRLKRMKREAAKSRGYRGIRHD